MATRRMQLVVLLLAILAAIPACNKKAETKTQNNAVTAAATDTKVKLFKLGSRDPIVLPPHMAKAFVEMLQRQPVHSEIGSMPAAPLGYFEVGEKHYLWHGNGVIYGKGSEELLWHGPVTQILIERWSKERYDENRLPQVVSSITEADLKAAQLEGPGAYPGGTDALHTAPLKTFEPK